MPYCISDSIVNIRGIIFPKTAECSVGNQVADYTRLSEKFSTVDYYNYRYFRPMRKGLSMAIRQELPLSILYGENAMRPGGLYRPTILPRTNSLISHSFTYSCWHNVTQARQLSIQGPTDGIQQFQYIISSFRRSPIQCGATILWR